MPRRDSKIALLALGLLFGWFIAEKGWHRHFGYLVVILALVAVIVRLMAS